MGEPVPEKQSDPVYWKDKQLIHCSPVPGRGYGFQFQFKGDDSALSERTSSDSKDTPLYQRAQTAPLGQALSPASTRLSRLACQTKK